MYDNLFEPNSLTHMHDYYKVQGGRGAGRTFKEMLDMDASMLYDSPITKIVEDFSQCQVKQEEDRLVAEIYGAVGYQIDKEQLIKALNYDREQFKKGYSAGFVAGVKTIQEVYNDLGIMYPEVDFEKLMEAKADERKAES